MAEQDEQFDYLEPYQFEPKKQQDESEDSWETYSSDSSDESSCVDTKRVHLNSSEWCKCGHCQRQMTDMECVCCLELDATSKLVIKENISCIINHPEFQDVCFKKGVLWTSMKMLEDIEGAVMPKKRDNATNKNWRYTSYRMFIWRLYGRLGRNNRRVIPSCAISRIRAEFEDDDADYTNFVGDDQEVREILTAMAWSKLKDD